MSNHEPGTYLKLTPQNSVNLILRRGVLRALLFALIWWILTEGVTDSWMIGIPVIFFATLASLVLLRSCSWSLLGIIRFVPFFLWYSLRGGVDVAKRALHPHLPISPVLYDYHWNLPPGMPRVFMANTVSLFPGTLSTELNKDCLRVHVLDQGNNFASELIKIEAHVASVFGLN